MTERYDVVVIGGGGTGSEITYRLARRRPDLRVALAERDRLGGECTNDGCVPTKVMLRSARIAQHARDAERFGVRIPTVEVDFRAVRRRAREVVDHQTREGPRPFERLGVTVYLQEARLADAHRVELADGTEVEAEHTVLATGTAPTVPPVPGLADGPYWTNREAIWKPDAPPASLAVIGAGAVGIEFAQIYSRFGTKVTVIEVMPQVLPNDDQEVAAAIAPVLEAEGIDLLTETTLERAEHGEGGWRLHHAGGMVGAEETLVATGRRPVFDVHDLEAAGVELDQVGRPVLTETLRTTAPSVSVAGDATGDLLFTHIGSYEAGVVADDILGTPHPRDYRVVPRVTFCDPEVASVGLTERDAVDAGRDVRTATVPLSKNERSLIDGRPAGVVKLVADARTSELLGGHIVGDEAGAMIHEVVAAMAGGLAPSTVGEAIHAYPTFSESVAAAFLELAERA